MLSRATVETVKIDIEERGESQATDWRGDPTARETHEMFNCCDCRSILDGAC